MPIKYSKIQLIMLNYTDNYLSQENDICYCINNNHDNLRLAFSPYSDYAFLQKCFKRRVDHFGFKDKRMFKSFLSR